MQRGLLVPVLVVLQLALVLAGAALTVQWVRAALPWQGWWANLPMVGILLGSLLVFSHEEARFGLAAARRKGKDPESMGGPLEAAAFFTWLLLLLNMIATVLKGIRALKAAV